MNTVNNSIQNWLNNPIPGAGGRSSGVGGADFASFLEGIAGMGGGSSGASGSLMDYLSRRFPNANFSEGSVGETPADVEEYFGNEEGDNVAVESAAAQAIAENPALASALEDIVAALEETAGETQPTEGARVQRNIMVTSVSIRFSFRRISGESGGTLSANELKTAFSEFSEKLRELALKFFGSGEDGEEDIDIVAEEPQAVEGGEGNPFSGYFGAGFSFSLYFSGGQWSSGSREAGGEGAGNVSMEDFLDSFRKQGNFQNYMNSTFSYAMAYGGGVGSGAFTSILNSGMGIFGMSPVGMWQQGGGFNFQFASSRGVLSELMAMLASMASSGGVTPAPPAEETPEPAPVEPPAEAAAVA